MAIPTPPVYELYAIRYAQRDAMRSSHFMGGDSHDGSMPMDYFVWVAVSNGTSVMVDLGFTREAALKRKREFLCDPIEALKLLDISPEDIKDVVITHLHYDHAGNFHLLPNARFHVQEPEMHFAAGRHMRYRYFSSGYEPDDIAQAVRLNFAGRMMQYNGEAEILPGIRVVPTPGHSPGQQAVSVNTRRGRVVLASDATHFYENLQKRRPYPAAHHVEEMLESFDRVMKLAGDIEHIIPGHDPMVMQLYPAARPGLEGRVARLDVEPAPMPERPSRRPAAA
jgi:glyoxylase-like metal-dependent hydrolase (beta-lactamase superfamily II)